MMNVIAVLAIPKKSDAIAKAKVVGKSIHTVVHTDKDGKETSADKEYSILIEDCQKNVRYFDTNEDTYNELLSGDLGKFKSIGNKLISFKKSEE